MEEVQAQRGGFDLPPLPGWVKMLNRLGEHHREPSPRQASIDVGALIDAARRRTGLTDLGDDDVETPLRLLTLPPEEGLGTTWTGQWAHRRSLVDCLENRLCIQEAVRRDPGLRERPIHAPIVIAGRGRSGTTLLQRLLSLDPARRALRTWEALHPALPTGGGGARSDRRVLRTRLELGLLLHVFPGLRAMHYSDAESPEECEWLLHNSLRIPGFLWKAPEFRPFNRWCEGQDATRAYEYHHLQLQILARTGPDRAWVLKGNEHIDHLAVLFKVFPGVRVIQTHRDPERCVASDLSLNFSVLGLRNRPERAWLLAAAREMMEGYARSLEGTIAVRSSLPSDQIADVHYAALTRDPVAVIRALYQRWDLPFSDEHRLAILAWMRNNPAGKYGRHSYDPGDFGIEVSELRARFARYTTHYQVPPERTASP